MELFKLDAGINVVHVPFKESAAATRDLVAGIVNAMILPASTAAPMAKTGRVRVLANLGHVPSATFPAAPLLKDEGYPSMTVGVWVGLMVPSGTPGELVEKLNGEMNAILAMADVKDLFAKQGLLPQGGRPERLAELVKSDHERWSRAVEAAKIKSD
jgi:tripartite-type tricarboxylate transporter receptor subunit TctC